MPVALGIIDGYFEGAPSVWHKEILYALDQGVHVYGSSSMGALRAAELHPFGMQGIGQIFEWFRDELLTDDDEVAVLHGPEAVGFIAASEPLVNIRATLSLARQQQIIDDVQHEALIDAAKATFYKQRSWNRLLEYAQEFFRDESLSAQLKDWLLRNRIDLKKQDAVQLLKTMHDNIAVHRTRHQPSFYFEWTNVWDTAFHEYGNARSSETQLQADHHEVLDELRLDPDRFERYRDKALLCWIVKNPVDTKVDDSDLKAALAQFRIDNQLGSRSQLLDYMLRTGTEESRLTALLEDASRVTQSRVAAGDLRQGIIDQLQLDGYYLNLLNISRAKQEAVNTTAVDPDKLTLSPPQILAWYFGQRLGTPIPKPLDVHLRKIDLLNTDDFYRLIAVDYLYWHKQG